MHVLCGVLLAALTAPTLGGPTLVHEDRVGDLPWNDVVALPAGLTALVLDAPEAGDADLSVEPLAGGPARVAASHLPREVLLLRGPGEFRLTVEAPPDTRFTLALTAWRPARAPQARSASTLRLDPTRRAVLLRAPAKSTLLHVERWRGLGDLDLAAFDADLHLTRLSEASPEREQTRLGADVAWVLVTCRGPETLAKVDLARPDPPGRLTRFLDRLPQTAPQRRAIRALRRNPDFLRIASYLAGYPGGLPLELRVIPGLRAHGVERFGTYSQGVLTVNPTKEEHRRNPQELVDTLIHELIHALLAMPRAEGYPLAADVLDASHDPVLQGTLTSPLRRSRLPPGLTRYLDAHYGPSASNPAEDFTDINAGAQRLLVKVIRDTLRAAECGRETLVFQNVRDRLEGAAK